MKTILDLKSFVSPRGETSYYKSIPIEFLCLTKKILKIHNIKYRILFRGPRTSNIDPRWKYSRQSNCLKKNATSFAVYPKF
jgi:hypothetical protein